MSEMSERFREVEQQIRSIPGTYSFIGTQAAAFDALSSALENTVGERVRTTRFSRLSVAHDSGSASIRNFSQKIVNCVAKKILNSTGLLHSTYLINTRTLRRISKESLQMASPLLLVKNLLFI